MKGMNFVHSEESQLQFLGLSFSVEPFGLPSVWEAQKVYKKAYDTNCERSTF